MLGRSSARESFANKRAEERLHIPLLVAITDAVRVLKPGGRLVIADVREPRSDGECLHEVGMRHLVTPARLALLVQWSVGGAPLLTAEKPAGDA